MHHDVIIVIDPFMATAAVAFTVHRLYMLATAIADRRKAVRAADHVRSVIRVRRRREE